MHELKSIMFKQLESIKIIGKIKVKISNALALDNIDIVLNRSSFFANFKFFKCSLSLFAAIKDNIEAIT